MAKRADSAYPSGFRTPNWLKIKTAKRQEVVIAGHGTAASPACFGGQVLAVREGAACVTSAMWVADSVIKPWRSFTRSF